MLGVVFVTTGRGSLGIGVSSIPVLVVNDQAM